MFENGIRWRIHFETMLRMNARINISKFSWNFYGRIKTIGNLGILMKSQLLVKRIDRTIYIILEHCIKFRRLRR
jgi:hypothetical protein